MMMKRVFFGATLALGLMAIPAAAADKGGNGLAIADLEERLAEIEATAVRKGNKKVQVYLYGTVNQAMLWVDGLIADQDKNVINNSADPTRFGIKGNAKINQENSAGFILEIGVSSKPALPILEDQLTVRHAAVWVENATLGRITVGHTSMATDYVTRITTANTDHVAPMLSLAPLSTALVFGLDLPFNNIRRDLVRWDSPTFGGFHVSASVANGDTPLGIGFNSDHAYDAAIRYAGEFSGFRVAAGAGYRDENFTLTSLNPLPLVRDKVMSGSASVMHVPSGLFVSAAIGAVKQELLFGGNDFVSWHAQAGWQQNIFKIGATTLYAEYGQTKIDTASFDPKVMGFGINQAIDAAALDLYVGFRQYDLDLGTDKVNAVMFGLRVRF